MPNTDPRVVKPVLVNPTGVAHALGELKQKAGTKGPVPGLTAPALLPQEAELSIERCGKGTHGTVPA